MSFNYLILPYLTYTDTTGNPLTGGYIQSYDSSNNQPAPFYQDSNGNTPYSNPLSFVNIAQLPPLYTDPNITTYLVEFYDNNDALVVSFDVTPPQSSSSSSSSNNTNLIVNGQFQFYESSIFSPAPSEETLIAKNVFYFEKDGSGAVDSIKFSAFALDSNDPSSTPQNYFNYTCTEAGTGETYKDLKYVIQNVRSLQNQEITFSAAAASLNSQSAQILLYIQQYFGTGGTPSSTVTTIIATYVLSITNTTYSSVFTVPDLTGKAIGTDGTDSLILIIRMPLNTTCDISITNIFLQQGSLTDISYPFETYEDTNSKIESTVLPTGTTLNNQQAIVYSTPSYNSSGDYVLQSIIPIGTIMFYDGTSNPGNGWYLVNGQSLPVSGYFSTYANLINYRYSLLSGLTTTDDGSTTTVSITLDQVGAVPTPTTFFNVNSSFILLVGSLGTSTTRCEFTVTTSSGSRFGKGNLGEGGSYNCGFVFTTADSITHLVLFQVDSYPITLYGGSSSIDYGTTTIVKISSSDSSDTVTSKLETVLNLAIPNGLVTSDNFYSSVSSNIVNIYNCLHGTTLNQPNAGTTPFTISVISSGSPSDYQHINITTVAASALLGGEYLTISTINYNFVFWFIIDGDGVQPAVTTDFYIPISILSSDTASQVASAVQLAFNYPLMNLENLNSMFIRGITDSNTNVQTYGFYNDYGPRFYQGNLSTNSNKLIPGTLEWGNIPYNIDDYDGGVSSVPTGGYRDPRPINSSKNYIIKVF